MAKCRIDGCFRFKLRRYKMCAKHSKRVDAGILSIDGVQLRPLKKVHSYNGIECSIPGCTTQARRNGLCETHSSMQQRGILDSDGNPNYKMVRYSEDATCRATGCHKKGKIIKGLCKTHYSSWRKGRIDYAGFEIRPKRRVYKYLDSDTCKVKGCIKKPRFKYFCEPHYAAYRRGYLDNNGLRTGAIPLVRNKGLTCSYTGCRKPAHCKSYCKLHYSRYATMKKDLGNPVRVYKNKGKVCTAQNCDKPAYCKMLCTTHYERQKKGMPENLEFTNKGKTCSNDSLPAYCKGLCRPCYGRAAYKEKLLVKKRITSGADFTSTEHATLNQDVKTVV